MVEEKHASNILLIFGMIFPKTLIISLYSF